jgi:asparagine synthase (glutamine-hydrolysing)
MCGLFGVLTIRHEPPDDVVEACHRLQAHRGPDGRGELRERLGPARLLLAHQRLSIIDLSTAAGQPMEDAAGRGAIVFNGELYNYIELRDELRAAGERFATASDTEVLLAALHHWGPASALARFNWMGAFAWLDRLGRRLVLARDPFGEKPLYVYREPGRLAFSSEIKTMLRLVNRRFTLDPQILTNYLAHGLIDVSEASIFSDIAQLRAGHFLVVAGEEPAVGEPQPYFWAEPASESVPEDPDGFAELIRSLILDAVRLRLRSDVPVGLLLSGGVDSSVLAAAAAQSERNGANIRLLAAVSDDPASDESPFIDRMAAHLRWPVIKVRLEAKPADLLTLLDRASWHNDHPVPYLGNLYHYLLMQKAHEHGITVILSGQGADEAFCGYIKYPYFHLLALLRGHPLAGLRWLWQLQRTGYLDHAIRFPQAKRHLLRRLPGVSAKLQTDMRGPQLRATERMSLQVDGASIVQRQVLDLVKLSIPSLCHTEDRMSMAWSREIRLPYLDPRLVRVMLAAPVEHKLRDGWTKYSLRRVAQGLVPTEIAWRRDKRGFSVPEGPLLRGPTGDLIESYMTPDSLVFQHGLVDRERWLALFRLFRSQRLGAGLIPSREVWAPWALEVWMRRYSDWVARGPLYGSSVTERTPPPFTLGRGVLADAAKRGS